MRATFSPTRLTRFLYLAIGVIAVLLPSCSSDGPVVPKTQQVTITPDDNGEILLATVQTPRINVGVLASNLSWDSVQQTASFDVSLVNLSNAPLPAPVRLITDELRPATVQFLNPDGAVEDGRLFMRFAGEFGTDGVLDTGERSAAKSARYFVGDEQAFSLSLSIERESQGGTISGVVFEDSNENGARDAGEPGLTGQYVTLTRVDQPSTQPVRQTDVTGAYEFINLDAGVYDLSVAVSADLLTTANPIRVVLIEDQNGVVGSYPHADFGVRGAGGGSPLVLAYNFNDGTLPDWSGGSSPADMAVENGALHLTTSSPPAWRFKIFDGTLPTSRYTAGTFEFMIMPGPEVCGIDLRGRAMVTAPNYTLDFGPAIQFNRGELRVLQGTTSVGTGVAYTPGQWYYVRIEYDANAGTVGRMKLFLRERDANTAEVYVGEFDFMASNGVRLSDVVQFGFGLSTHGTAPTWMYLDDVHLKARE